jgi:predicted alpha/beta hydrolase family esterase
MDRRFLVLHGWPNRRPRQHWQWQLTEALRREREQVLYPQLPDPDAPSRSLWTEVLRAELAQLGAGERVVVAHSLSALLWLHATALLGPDERVDRVLLVAPPAPSVVAGFADVREFADLEPDGVAVTSAAGSTRIVAGDDDPYCPAGAADEFAHLGVQVDLLHGQGHLDPDAGYGAWPGVLRWCLDGVVPVPARPPGAPLLALP